LDLWQSPPFSAEVRDGYLYARGVSDDKGQVFCHWKAIEALLKTSGELPVNIKMIIEGEEEIGSLNLPAFIHAERAKLAADVALISDTPMFGPQTPSLCTSLRGMVYTELVLRGCASDLHSGQHGGAVPNPIQALSQIISKLKDAKERVTVPGFYDSVLAIDPAMKRSMKRLPFDEKEYLKQVGAPELVGEKGYSALERRWLRPTLECNGIIGGYTGEGAKTVIPAVAKAKISMRLVANQDPAKIFEAFKAHVRSLSPKNVTVEILNHSLAFPARVRSDHPAVQAGLRALRKGFGKEPVFQGEGGTIPIVAEFERVLGLQTVLMGFNLPDDGIHAPNERFKLDNFYGGILAAGYFLEEYARSVG
jgi:acetylornithine deacetylase/succinyl-diaminopimelate desuccinylase-like protein